MEASQFAPPVIIRTAENHSASLIFFHGLGDQGDGWADVFESEIPIPYMKCIFPNAQSRPVTLSFGMWMPAWYDILAMDLSIEDDQGIEQDKNYVHALIREEMAAGIPSRRIAIDGFSMGGALSIYAGLTFDQPLGCIISMSGFLLQRNKIPGNNTANLNTPIFLGHGRQDFLVPFDLGEMTERALRTFNPNVHLEPYGCRHESTEQEHQDVCTFIKTHIPPAAAALVEFHNEHSIL